MVETLSEKQTYQLIFHNLFPLWIFSVPEKLISEKKNYICLISIISPLKIKNFYNKQNTKLIQKKKKKNW